MHELNYLRKELAGGKTLSEATFRGLVNADTGTLHLEAWRRRSSWWRGCGCPRTGRR